MEVLGQLRSELPCGAVRKRYGKEIHGPVRDFCNFFLTSFPICHLERIGQLNL